MDDSADATEPPPTAPKGLNYAMRGFTSEEDARTLAYVMQDAVEIVSQHINLSMLDGITVAYDYDEALAELDRGVEGLKPLSASKAEVVGIAMSPTVIREGVPKTHIVFGAPYVVGLLADEANDDLRFAIGVVAHECAHVEVNQYWEQAFPGCLLGKSFETVEEAAMQEIAEVCWEEYAACRLSARFNRQSADEFASSIVAVCENAREKARREVVAYRTHGDLRRLVFEVGGVMHFPLKCSAYLLGTFDGLEMGWDSQPEAREALTSSDFVDLVDEMRSVLRQLWAERGRWTDWDAFQPLRDIAHQVYRSAGLNFRGDYVDVPFTLDTMW